MTSLTTRMSQMYLTLKTYFCHPFLFFSADLSPVSCSLLCPPFQHTLSWPRSHLTLSAREEEARSASSAPSGLA